MSPSQDEQRELSWMEYNWVRETYGILYSLANRPLSFGNQIAVVKARKDIEAIMADMSLHEDCGVLLSPAATRVLTAVLGAIGEEAPMAVGWSLAGSVAAALELRFPYAPEPMSYMAALGPAEISSLVIQVGPAIGVGDELLVARALIERAASLGTVDLCVSSSRPQLWTWSPQVEPLQDRACLGALRYVEAMSAQERARAGYVYVDFIRAPCEAAYVGPQGLSYAGYWDMGKARGRIFDRADGLTYTIRYPDGLPTNRWLECRWAAGRLLPRGSEDRSPSPALCHIWPVDAGHLCVQTLTSKPSLMLPPDFYVDVITRITESTGVPREVRFLSSPVQEGQGLIDRAAELLSHRLRDVPVVIEAGGDLAHVSSVIGKSGLLIGPDTFTTHFGVLHGRPQIVITLPQHEAWVNTASPTVTVYQSGDIAQLVEGVVSAGCAMLDQGDPGMAAVDDQALAWATSLSELNNLVRRFLHDGDPRVVKDASAQVEALHDVLVRLHILARLDQSVSAALAQVIDSTKILSSLAFDPTPYGEEEDKARALTRWYHRIASSNLSGLLLTRHVYA